MHVVVANLYLDPAGRSSEDILAGWRDFGRGFAAAVAAAPGLRVTLAQTGWSDHRSEVLGMDCRFVREANPIWRLPGGRVICRLPRRLYATIASLAPDLIHHEGLVLPRLLRGLAGAMPEVPLVAQDHGTKLRAGWRRWIGRWGFAPLAGAMFTAREQAEPFQQAGVLRPDLPIYEVLEGSSDFQPGDRAAARAATGLEGDPCLLWLGQLDPNKDPIMVLEAVARASTSLPGLQLYMCYRRAPLLEAVRRRIASDERLTRRVTLLGEVPFPGTEPYLRAADFVVQGSHAEGSGFAAIEAFACGTTPLITDIPSLRRIAGDGKFGAVVPVGDPAALAAAIVTWSARDQAALRRQARQHFETSLSFPAVGRELRATYEEARGRR